MKVSVGVDIGSTATKIVVLDPTDVTLATVHLRSEWFDGDGSASSVLVGQLVTGVGNALREAEESSGQRLTCVGLGLASFAESGILVGEDGEDLTSVIPWYDTRGSELLSSLPIDFREGFPGVTGLPVTAQWSLFKLLWFRSQGLRISGTWLSVAEYIAYRLTGEQYAEPSLASRTGMLDQDRGEPFAEARTLLGTGAEVLPPLRRAGQAWGQAGAGFDAVAGVPVTVAGHDHLVAAHGHGVSRPDEMLNSFGTADALVRILPATQDGQQRAALVANGFTLGSHIQAAQSVVLGGTRGGLVLRRVLSLLGEQHRAELDQAAAAQGVDAVRHGGLVTIRGADLADDDVVISLRGDATPSDVWSAAVGHISDEMATVIARLLPLGPWPSKIVVTGGWVRMDSIWRSRLNVLPGAIRSHLPEAGAIGAALLGRVASESHFSTAR